MCLFPLPVIVLNAPNLAFQTKSCVFNPNFVSNPILYSILFLYPNPNLVFSDSGVLFADSDTV